MAWHGVACGNVGATANLDSPLRATALGIVGRGEETGFQIEQGNLHDKKESKGLN
jgi:hypothetical protein